MAWTLAAVGPVTSPNYPSDYDNNSNFQQKVTVGGVDKLRLVFSAFDMEPGNDTLKVLDEYTANGGTVHQTLSGNLGSTRFRSDSVNNDVIAWWHQTDASGTRSGWQITHVEYYVAADTSKTEIAEITATITAVPPTVNIQSANTTISLQTITLNVTPVNPIVYAPSVIPTTGLSLNIVNPTVVNGLTIDLPSFDLNVETANPNTNLTLIIPTKELTVSAVNPTAIQGYVIPIEEINLTSSIVDPIINKTLTAPTINLTANAINPIISNANILALDPIALTVESISPNLIADVLISVPTFDLTLNAESIKIFNGVLTKLVNVNLTAATENFLAGELTQEDLSTIPLTIFAVPPIVSTVFNPDDYTPPETTPDFNLPVIPSYLSIPLPTPGSYSPNNVKGPIKITRCFLNNGDFEIPIESCYIQLTYDFYTLNITASINDETKDLIVSNASNESLVYIYHYWGFQTGQSLQDSDNIITTSKGILNDIAIQKTIGKHSTTLRGAEESGIDLTNPFVFTNEAYFNIPTYWNMNVNYASGSITFDTEIDKNLKPLDMVYFGRLDNNRLIIQTLTYKYSSSDSYMSIDGILMYDAFSIPYYDRTGEHEKIRREITGIELDSDSDGNTTGVRVECYLDDGSTPFEFEGFTSCYVQLTYSTDTISITTPIYNLSNITTKIGYFLKVFHGKVSNNGTAVLTLVKQTIFDEIQITDEEEGDGEEVTTYYNSTIKGNADSSIDLENQSIFTNTSLSNINNYWNLSRNYKDGTISFDTELNTSLSPLDIISLAGYSNSSIIKTITYKFTNSTSYMNIDGIMMVDVNASGIYDRGGEHEEIRREITGIPAPIIF